MKDLAWMIVVGLVAATVGWFWQSSRQQSEAPRPTKVVRGERMDGGTDSIGEGSGGSIADVTPVGSGVGTTDGSGSDRSPVGSGSGEVDPPRFGPRPKASPHEVVTIAKPRLTRLPDGLFELNIPYLANYKAMLPVKGQPEARPVPAKIPDFITKLHGQRVRIRGFMIALQIEQEKAVRFLLSRYSFEQCCYGLTPEPNEYVVVFVEPENATPPIAEGTILVTGTFDASPEVGPQGQLQSLFRIKAEKVVHMK